MQCTNQLKQLGLAIHNYHSTYDTFPAGANANNAAVGNDIACRKSAFCVILPFMEQMAIYDAVIAPKADPTGWNTFARLLCIATPNAADNGGWNTQIKTLLCPSDGNQAKDANEAGKTSYRISLGDYIDACFRNRPNPRGLFSNFADGQKSGTEWGTPPAGLWNSVASLTDGTSNTIAFSEAALFSGSRLTSNGTPPKNSGGSVMGSYASVAPGAGGPIQPSVDKDPTNSAQAGSTQLCLTTAAGKNYHGNQDVFDNVSGAGWGLSSPIRTSFMTILPPNSPSCINEGINYNATQATSGGSGSSPNTGLISASSYHPGGVNVCYGDGAVKFASDTINAVDNTLLSASGGRCVSSGASPFGIWGALGSRDGGESVPNP